MGLALLARGGHLDFVSEHGLFLGRDGLGRLQVEGDGKFAVLVGACLAVGDLLVLNGRVPPPPATPGEGSLADDTIGVFHIVQAETSVGFHIAVYRHLLVEFVLLLRTLKVDLEGRALVFLYADGHATMVGVEVEHAVQSVGRDDERPAERAVFVGDEIRRADELPVGIAEGNVLLVVVDNTQFFTLTACRDALEIDGLSWAIDGAVGEELCAVSFVVVSVSFVKAEIVV